MSTPTDLAARPTTPDKGLAADSVGLLSMVSLGLASVAPAYSITVTLGLVVLAVGHLAPAALLVGFVPILCTAYAFRELNRVMPDCGTNFVWITRSFGPWIGWIFGNWLPQTATLIAMTALAQVGATNLLDVAGLTDLAGRTLPVTCLGALLIALATAVGYRGVQLSAAVQTVMVAVQLAALIGFGVAALAAHDAASEFSPGWLNPFAFHGTGPFAQSVLLCLFIYWGWDAALTVNEEARDRTRTLAGPRCCPPSSCSAPTCSPPSPRSASPGRARPAWGWATRATPPTSSARSPRRCSAPRSRRACNSRSRCRPSPHC